MDQAEIPAQYKAHRMYLSEVAKMLNNYPDRNLVFIGRSQYDEKYDVLTVDKPIMSKQQVPVPPEIFKLIKDYQSKMTSDKPKDAGPPE